VRVGSAGGNSSQRHREAPVGCVSWDEECPQPQPQRSTSWQQQHSGAPIGSLMEAVIPLGHTVIGPSNKSTMIRK
jgi:hypothetical protein